MGVWHNFVKTVRLDETNSAWITATRQVDNAPTFVMINRLISGNGPIEPLYPR